MSNYYTKRDAKVNIAHYLMGKGWEILEYYPDESDIMTDYYSPAHWGGIAIKNGFILVVDNRNGREEYEIKKYNNNSTSFSDRGKITKLEQMTQENGCTAEEEESAKQLIETLKNKNNNNDKPEFEVIGVVPAYMGNPRGAIWHIEKNGKLYDKGNALTKFADIPESYMFNYDTLEYTDQYKKVKEWNNDINTWEWVKRTPSDKQMKNITAFKKFMGRIEKIANSEEKVTDGTAEGQQAATNAKNKEGYEKVTITEYKKEIQVKEIETPDELKADMYFMLKVNFNHGCYKGNVYKINSVKQNPYNNKYYIDANRMNKKLNKTLTGRATTANNFHVELEKLNVWIEKGSISIVELVEVETPVQVEKWVKIDKTQKTYNNTDNSTETGTKTDNTAKIINMSDYDYTITEDTDTRDNSQIWILKIQDKLSKDEYIMVSNYIKTLGGYYSRFKKGFLFKDDPTSILNNKDEQKEDNSDNITEPETQNNDEQENSEMEQTEQATSNTFDFDNILNKFDNVEIENNKRISTEDEEFCITEQESYNEAIIVLNNIKNVIFEGTGMDITAERITREESTNSYLDWYTFRDIGDIFNAKKESFIHRIIGYFTTKYNVTIDSYDVNKKYENMEVDYNTLLDEIFEQLGGFSFQEKAEDEIKEAMKKLIYSREDWRTKKVTWNIEIKNKKVSLINFVYPSKGWQGEYEYNGTNSMMSLCKALSLFNSNNTEILYNFREFCTYGVKEWAFDKHDLNMNKIDTMRIFKNGKVELEFKTVEYAQQFAKEYCGYTEEMKQKQSA